MDRIMEKGAYRQLLEQYGLTCRQSDNWLFCGETEGSAELELLVTVTCSQVYDLMENLLPMLQSTGVPFKLVRDLFSHYRLNEGVLGPENIGRVISIYPGSVQQAIDLARSINQATTRFRGPRIRDVQRIGNIVYANGLGRQGNFHSYKTFKGSGNRRIMGKYYLPYAILHDPPKGFVYQAINLKKFACSWCLVKEGRIGMGEDDHGREVKDRLEWEKEVLEDLKIEISVPTVLDFVQQDEDCLLVLEWLEGRLLQQVILSQFQAYTRWDDIPRQAKQLILGHFLGVTDIIKCMHAKGYIHRDITDSNFMLTKKGKLVAIDMELSYSVKKCRPHPPFIMGTAGYVSPQQLAFENPEITDDIFSLGALLLFMLTGQHPLDFVDSEGSLNTFRLAQRCNENILTELVKQCYGLEPRSRPSIDRMQQVIRQIKSSLNQGQYEKSLVP